VVVSIGKVTDVGYYLSDNDAGAEDAAAGASDGAGDPGRGNERARGPGAASYYLDAVVSGEPPGRWGGSGAAILGLSGEVAGDDMRRLYGRFEHPRTGEAIGSRPARRTTVEERLAAALAKEPDALPERVAELRRDVERTARKSVIAWDATFSVPKSVTVAHTAAHRAQLAAERSGDHDRADRFRQIREGIESAIHDATTEMIRYAESLATARTGGGAGAPVEWIAAPGLTVASFFQHTNRNVDPQLHVHNVILNRAVCADGKVRALDGADLLRQRFALAGVAERVLEERLTALGFTWELRPDGMARELTVIPTEVAELYSSRSRQMSAAVQEWVTQFEERIGREVTDLELHHIKNRVTLLTRQAKPATPETRTEMMDRWHATLAGAVGHSLDSLAERIAGHVIDTLATRREHQASVWSPSAVLSEAVAACAEARSTWLRSDLLLEISRRLPSLGGLDPATTCRVLDRLTDTALAGPDVQQITALDTIADADLAAEDASAGDSTGAAGGHANPGRGPLASLTRDPHRRPSSVLYAATGTLAAEEALRRAAVARGGHTLDPATVRAWLTEHATDLGDDQRAAIEGLATTSARLAVLVGPAGTGKSHTTATLAHAWAELADGGRVIGLATSQIATQVLTDDGISHARNIARWLATQHRLSTGSSGPQDEAWRVGPRDLVVVDEASMVATADLTRIRTVVEAAGARLVLTGDPRQLGAVQAGGVLDLLDGHAETYTLADVRRFTTPWERDASLRLRAGDRDALTEYDRHGRLLTHPTPDAAMDAVAAAAVADRLGGRTVLVLTGTNAQAAAVATRVRDRLVALGIVTEAGVLLGRDGCTAGVGDVIATRRNDRALTVTNRAQYVIDTVHDDGSLTVHPLAPGDQPPTTGTRQDDDQGVEPRAVHLPADYVAAHVQLGYAATIHAGQGLTVDNAHLLTDGALDPVGLYVGMSRGRIRNTAHVITTPDAADLPDRPVQLTADTTRPSALAVLDAVLDRDPDTTVSNQAATVARERDQERAQSAATLTGHREALIRAATRDRLERHLDDLTAAGALPAEARARLCADQATEHLSRVLRAAELTGHHPRHVLEAAVTAGPLDTAESVAQVLSHRIRTTGPAAEALSDPAAGTTSHADAPVDLDPEAAAQLAEITDSYQARQRLLGHRLTTDPPSWAVTALGPVPTETAAHDDWARRAGAVAAYREATGWDDPHRALGPMPGLATTERRADYATAWHALGRPETGLDETALTDGRLRVRIRAAQAELAWAPPHVDNALRHAETTAETARQAAATARAQADAATAAGDATRLLAEAAAHEADHTVRAAAATRLAFATQARATWVAATAPTRDAGERALRELTARGLTPGSEPDRTTAEEWLAAEHAARHADDAHRPIAEHDLTPEVSDDLGRTHTRTLSGNSTEPATTDHRDNAEETVVAETRRATGHQVMSTEVVDTYVSTSEDWDAFTRARRPSISGDAAPDHAVATPEATAGPTWATRGMPVESTDDELHVAVTAAALAMDRARNRDIDHTTPTDVEADSHESWLHLEVTPDETRTGSRTRYAGDTKRTPVHLDDHATNTAAADGQVATADEFTLS
jgi:conjugative relaxase-like TrwC/TraI family protein